MLICDTSRPVNSVVGRLPFYARLIMTNVEEEIREIVNRETAAWNTKDIKLLMSIFHPDMVWPWPPTEQSHDSLEWVFWADKYNYERWSRNWQILFDTH